MMFYLSQPNKRSFKKLRRTKKVVNQREKLFSDFLAHPLPRISPHNWFMLTEVPPQKWGHVHCGAVGGAKRGVMSHINVEAAMLT